MIIEGLKDDEVVECNTQLDIKELFVLALATSIDALAVGITFAFLKVSILPSSHNNRYYHIWYIIYWCYHG